MHATGDTKKTSMRNEKKKHQQIERRGQGAGGRGQGRMRGRWTTEKGVGEEGRKDYIPSRPLGDIELSADRRLREEGNPNLLLLAFVLAHALAPM